MIIITLFDISIKYGLDLFFALYCQYELSDIINQSNLVKHDFIAGAGHNDIELYSQYLERLRQFLNVELSSN